MIWQRKDVVARARQMDSGEGSCPYRHTEFTETRSPKTPDEIRELVLKLPLETSWGYTRILGELRKLGVGVGQECLPASREGDPGREWHRPRSETSQDDMGLTPEYVMRDNDAKYTAQYIEVLKSSAAIVKRNTPLSPNLRAHVGRFIQTLKFECLNRFIIVAEKHFDCVYRV